MAPTTMSLSGSMCMCECAYVGELHTPSHVFTLVATATATNGADVVVVVPASTPGHTHRVLYMYIHTYNVYASRHKNCQFGPIWSTTTLPTRHRPCPAILAAASTALHLPLNARACVSLARGQKNNVRPSRRHFRVVYYIS